MPIKPVSAEQIEQAAEEFDRDLRSTSGWENWQHKGNQRYALKWRNKLYPPKTIIALATGQKVQTFSGGSEANEYLASRDFEIQTIGLPSETEVKIALHELLLSRDSHEITPAEAYAEIARQLEIPPEILARRLPNGENHFENRVRFARRKLVDDQILEPAERGVWRLAVRVIPKVWVEKTLVEGRQDRASGPFALGEVLWSPQRSRTDYDEYWEMRCVQPGDVVIHLVDNKAIAGVSKVKDYASPDFRGLAGTAWADVPGYIVPLEAYTPCSPVIPRDAFLGNKALAPELRRIRSEFKNLFYDRDLNLVQGSYLTEAPDDLVSALNRASNQTIGASLPHLGGRPATGFSSGRAPYETTTKESPQRISGQTFLVTQLRHLLSIFANHG